MKPSTTIKLLVLSDNHGQKATLQKIKAKFAQKVDAILHCGDSLLSADDKLLENCYCVRGNCDFDTNFVVRRVICLGAYRILLTHGNREGVNFGLDKLGIIAKTAGADLVCFGHTHQLEAVKQAGVVFVNPGSLDYPRGKYQSIGGTAALVELNEKQIKVQYVDGNGTIIPQLAASFTI